MISFSLSDNRNSHCTARAKIVENPRRRARTIRKDILPDCTTEKNELARKTSLARALILSRWLDDGPYCCDSHCIFTYRLWLQFARTVPSAGRENLYILGGILEKYWHCAVFSTHLRTNVKYRVIPWCF